MSTSPPYSLTELAALLELEYEGRPETQISGIATLVSAKAGDLSFYTSARYLPELSACQASVVIIEPQHAARFSGCKLLSSNPYLSYARATQLFNRTPQAAAGIHPSAVLAADVKLGEGVCIAAHAVLEAGVELGPGVHVGAGSFIGQNSRIGADSRIHANVTIAHDVVIGERVVLASGAVIGTDGFGYAHDGKAHLKIAQLGRVIIGDDVEVGANTSIDRGALDDTRIERGVKIDNQVQIAHNVVIGEHSIVCGCVGIAGSARIGKRCILAGGVGVANHVEIADDVTVTGMTLVNQSIREKGSYSSPTLVSDTRTWRRNALRFLQLDELAKQISSLQKKLRGDTEK